MAEEKNINIEENAFGEDDETNNEATTKKVDLEQMKSAAVAKPTVSSKDVDVVSAELEMDALEARELLEKFDGDIVDAIRSYVEPNYCS